ncbi:RHS domain-containing protein, partial [Massilia sp. CT11-108]|uniref:RHS domain-containing protein n=1 Tax=Massilia sp. CT11-108 TaxID=3393900 RepID=UPI0039A6DF9D
RNGVTRYSYDPIGRILSAVQPQSSERFAFDPAHNLIDATVAPVGRVEGNRIRVYEDKRYDYDAHGNVVEKLVGKHTRMRFEWNPAHQLVRSVVSRGPSDVAQTVSYAYDPFGRRIAKRDAFGVTRFVWDGNRLLCEQRGSHSRTYVYGEDAFVPLARVDAVADSGGAARAEVRHLHTDHLGTPREMTDAGGR